MVRTVFTIGHSRRTWDEFLSLLTEHSIGFLADIRRFPGSRRHPQYGQESLRAALSECDVGYQHFRGLGGRRTARREHSPNTAWNVEAFNAYADHLKSAEFQADFDALQQIARRTPSVIMCAEALPWQCHRRIVSDVLLVHGWQVVDILSAGRSQAHRLTPFARVTHGLVEYPARDLFDSLDDA